MKHILFLKRFYLLSCINLMLITIAECFVWKIINFVVILFVFLFCRCFSHFSYNYDPSTASSVGMFLPCFLYLWWEA